MPLEPPATTEHGIVTRRALLTEGKSPADIRRLLRRRELTVVHPGVYVDHTGPLTWEQRAIAAVVHAWPAALAGPSALAVAGLGTKDADIHLVVSRGRRVLLPDDVTLRRTDRLEQRVQWNAMPPRLRIEEAVLDLAAAAPTRLEAVAILTAPVRARRTTAPRLAHALARRKRFPDRRWFAGVLSDLAEGVHSTLEHGYVERVERAHGLPRGTRQAAGDGPVGRVYRDAAYDGLIVELDGRAHHDHARARDRDFDRDLDAALSGLRTVRLTYGQVFDRPCTTALKIAGLLQEAGWTGHPHPCARQRCRLVSPTDTQRHR